MTNGAERKHFVAANGHATGHFGRNIVQLHRKRCPAVLSLAFEVTDVTMPLVAVRRIIEQGSEVMPDRDGGRIINKARGSETPLACRGGCYVPNVDL